VSFSAKIIEWYTQHQRDLPWRNTKDPYLIWLSEIMLQQTRVAQGLPYYLAFTKAFPKVENLAEATEENVLKLWQGLGYYSRARNLHATAKWVAHNQHGNFPTTKKDLLQLKGVGDYTASAVASFAFDEAVAVVDGNVNRVLSRYYGIDLPVNEKPGQELIKEKATLALDANKPALHNQAIMEFGALQCKPKNPYCNLCPLQNECVAFQQGKVDLFPIKIKKTKVQTRYLTYFVFQDANLQTLIQQRTGKGIWENLYEFPHLEFLNKTSKKKIQEEFDRRYDMQIASIEKANPKPIVHLLSHRKLIADFYIVTSQEIPQKAIQEHQKQVSLKQLEAYPVPVLIANFIKDYLL
jgi:A/G-specific adenine glycosylase